MPWIRDALWLAGALVAGYFAYAACYAAYSRPPSGRWVYTDGLDAGRLKHVGWPGMRQLAGSHSARIAAAPDHEGHAVLRFQLDSTDRRVRGSLRAELRLRPTRPRSWNHYAFSLFLPFDWPDDAPETIVAQWHSVPDRWAGEAHLPSPLQLSVAGGRWRLSSAWDGRRVIRRPWGRGAPRGRAVPLDLPVEKGRWVDWEFRVRWSCDASGVLIVRKDGTEVVHRSGPNMYHDAIGPYFKFGLYVPGDHRSDTVDRSWSVTLCVRHVRVIQGLS